MNDNLIISISREYGSGGREIGERLASTLGIAYYDKELINRIVQKSGLPDDVVEAHDEKVLNRFLFTRRTGFSRERISISPSPRPSMLPR